MKELKCSKCKEMLSEDKFAKAKDRKSGRRPSCKECDKAYQRKYAKENSGKKKAWKEANKDKWCGYLSKYHEDNKEKNNAKNKEWREKNKEYLRKYNKKRYDEYPMVRLRNNISNLVGHSLRRSGGSKAGTSFFEYVPYTLQQLKSHLESLFEPWMSWQNYGNPKDNEKTWWVDHILPQSSFNYTSMDDGEFTKCWALSNLQPLERIENIRKGNKIT